jgi:hypothetical protein
VDADQLTQRLAAQCWRGQIIGAHGAGKTTLLHTWLPTLTAAGRVISWWTLRDGQRTVPSELLAASRSWDAQTLVVVDGYEQLGRLARWRLARRCRRVRAGLLVTTHRDAGLPTVLEVAGSLPTVQTLVEQLLRDEPGAIRRDDVAACYDRCRGNLREIFFALYDLYEARQRPSAPRRGGAGRDGDSQR